MTNATNDTNTRMTAPCMARLRKNCSMGPGPYLTLLPSANRPVGHVGVDATHVRLEATEPDVVTVKLLRLVERHPCQGLAHQAADLLVERGTRVLVERHAPLQHQVLDSGIVDADEVEAVGW